MDIQAVRQFINEWIDVNGQEFVDCAMSLFHNPELGMQEFKAVEILTGIAARHGFAVESGVAGMPTAFVATYGSGKPVIGFSAEYDSLPGLSQKVVSHKEPVREGAPGHGCGHCLLGSAALAAAVAVRYAAERFGFACTVKLFGTPAEELCVGKPFMARAGLFSGLDAMLDWHPSCFETFVARASNAYFSKLYHFSGETAHGNAPWNGRSALDGAVLMGQAAEMMREHIQPGVDSRPNTFNYTFSDVGPEFPVVVPDRSTAWFIGRFTTTEIMEDFLKRLDRCAEGAAMATGTEVRSELLTAIHEKIPNETLGQLMHENYLAVGAMPVTGEEQAFAKEVQRSAGREPVGITQEPRLPCTQDSGVSDISEYSWFAPTAMFRPGIFAGPLHHWTVTAIVGSSIGRRSVGYAAKILAGTAADLAAKPDVLAAAWAEQKTRMRGRSYKSLIPDTIPPPLETNRQLMEKYSQEDCRQGLQKPSQTPVDPL
ncbi:Amidohydrolase [uncultured delta proteobacterium]|uniref:Amidohydrolase n=1 Tax=uncultured delta proteobacterium TaxID=34034 RepID=A0A212JCI4_9DELT|nr:Amidohydrolase [uncultured delta proteobacterium]